MNVFNPSKTLKIVIIVFLVLALVFIYKFEFSWFSSDTKDEVKKELNETQKKETKIDHFPISIDFLERLEGQLSHDSIDTGGRTYSGITIKYHPDWDGWKIIDLELHPKHKHAMMSYLVLDKYREIWDTQHFEHIKDEDKAKYLFEYYVHTPSIFHSVINKLSKGKGNIKKGLDSVSIKYINDTLNIDTLCFARVKYYTEVVLKNESQTRFLKGWKKRARREMF